jgi:ElaA protein
MPKIIQWQCASFEELSGKQIYAILQARIAVFAIEQNCVYQDLDDYDFAALHLIAWTEANKIAAYLRITAPNTYYPEPSLGRVLSTADFRNKGIGRQLMLEGIKQLNAHYPLHAIRINAQVYLREFYRSFGFESASEEYLEDGIAHIQMLRRASAITSKTSPEI